MSGLDTEEPMLQPGRVDVLRNLCLSAATSSKDDWQRVVSLMQRLFNVMLQARHETARGSIALRHRQPGVKEALDLSSAGRGFLQMLRVDEPDTHLEILRH